ncbi:ABC transporter permease [Dongia mobilis]|jgi:peptide/nickel transport system permease protein|uniref:ABC transporter permease n=1 Tax=Dongia sp. TaxID=1977262 RepID=UPI0026ECE8B9
MVIGAILKRKLALLGLIVIAIFAAAAILAPWLAPYDPTVSPGDFAAPPSAQFWFGTDLLGRDFLSRLIYGARATLIIGILANGIAVLIGTVIGVTAGYLRGWVGSALMRFTDLMMAFPALLLAILLAAIFDPSLWIVVLVIAMVSWVQIARVVYAETISLAEREYVVAVRSVGASSARIILRHILPHLVPTLIVWGTLGIATTSLFEATLSFLGIGVQPPTPSWGNMVNENQTYFEAAPWLVFIPGIAIGLLALSFNLIGDALRDILDPTLRGRH